MSGLAGVFEEDDSGDINSLRYVAPKAPKQKKKKSSSEKNSAISKDNSEIIEREKELESSDKDLDVTANTNGTKPKVLTYASVRLYQVNNSKEGVYEYEACAGGNLLGCIIIGAGIKYQILIYDGNKIPLATTPISIGFDYNVSNSYMTFCDTRDVYYAVLFDSKEMMQTYLRNIMTVKIHIAQKLHESMGSASKSSTLTPATLIGPIFSEEDKEASTLDAGAVAGVNISIWEMTSLSPDAYVVDVSQTSPLHAVTNEKDLTKIDVTNNSNTSRINDLMCGIGNAISGFKKGDTIILGIPPHLNQNGSVDLSERKDSESWMMVEVKILRVKSARKNTKKISFEDEKVVEPATEEEQDEEQQEIVTDIPASTASLAERMAKISRQAGGGMQALAIAMGTQAVKQNIVKHVETGVMDDKPSLDTTLGPTKDTGNNNDSPIKVKLPIADQEKNRVEESHEKEVKAIDPKKPDESALATAATTTALQISPVRKQKEISNGAIPAVPSPTATATATATDVTDPVKASSLSSTVSDAAVTKKSDISLDVMSAVDSDKHFSQIQNSLSSILYGLTQLQTKVDQVATTISQNNQNYNPGTMVSGSPGTESALVMQLQQMLQLQQMNMLNGSGMGVVAGVAKRNSMNASSPGFVDSSDISGSIRHNETVAAVEQLYKDYEEVCDQLKEEKNKKVADSISSASNNQVDREAITQYEERCRQLEERTNKLMDEKSTLLEKQSSILQRLSDAHDRADDLRAETERNNSKIGGKVVDILKDELHQIIDKCEGIEETVQSSLIIQIDDVIKKHI